MVAVFIQTGYADIFHIGIHIVLRHGKGDDGTRHLIFRLGTVLLISPCQLAPEIAQGDEGDLRTGEQVQVVLIHAVDGAVHIGVHRQAVHIVLILQNQAVAVRQIHGGICGLVDQVSVMQGLNGQIGEGNGSLAVHQFHVFHGMRIKHGAFLIRPEHGHGTVFDEIVLNSTVKLLIVGNAHGNLHRSVCQRAFFHAMVVQLGVFAGHIDLHGDAARFADIIAGVQRICPIGDFTANVAPMVVVFIHAIADGFIAFVAIVVAVSVDTGVTLGKGCCGQQAQAQGQRRGDTHDPFFHSRSSLYLLAEGICFTGYPVKQGTPLACDF